MRLGIFGTGMIVKEVLPVLAATEGLELVAILATPGSLQTGQALAQTYGMAYASSQLEDILSDSSIDTVYVALPNHLHHAYSRKALLAGKHVICEKPFTLNLADFDDLAQLAQERGLFLLEAITNQYLPEFAALKNRLPELGAPKLLLANFSQYSSRYNAFQEGQLPPAFDPEKGGGALRDLNIYNIHLIVGLFGQPKGVAYVANCQRGVDTSGVLTLDYGDFQAVLLAAKDCDAPGLISLQGNQGTLSVAGRANSLGPISFQAIHGARQDLDILPASHRMAPEFAAFVAIVDSQDQARADQALAHSRAVMVVLDQAAQYDRT